jgi:multiple sugar transport system substrate-binding protein
MTMPKNNRVGVRGPASRAEKYGGISRRAFLTAGSVLGVAAAVGPWVVTSARAAEKSLKILQWSHFVPTYDKWFDAFAKKWGQDNGVQVRVDHISIADLGTATASEIAAGTGHELIELGPEAAQFEPSLIDLADINQEMTSKYGKPFGVAERVSYNPVTKKRYAFCHGWTIDAGDFRKSLWQKAGTADGPATWEDLLTVGAKIKSEQGVQVGIGMSQEIDSNMAARAVLWSYGTSLQDEDGKVVLDQGKYLKRSVDAVKYMKSLYEKALTPEVFAWNAASNNQALIAGRASYILNSISAYRSAQHARPDIAKDVFFTPALKGPEGTAWANVHVLYNYVVPTFAKANAGTAKQFIAHLVANYDEAMYHSKLYNSPTYPDTPLAAGKRGYAAVSGAKDLNDLTDAWFDDDPFRLDGEAKGKLKVLKTATTWTTNLGHPGYASPAIGEVFSTFVIPNMMANAAQGKVSPEEAVKTAADQIRKVFDTWHERGLVNAG